MVSPKGLDELKIEERFISQVSLPQDEKRCEKIVCIILRVQYRCISSSSSSQMTEVQCVKMQ